MIDHSVLYSLQDHLRTGTRDHDHPIVYRCKKHQQECNFRDVFQTDLDLMITQMEIDLGEDVNTDKLIKQNIDAGQCIFVLDGDDIQRSIINT
jgi:hypothetical protein